MLLSLLLACAPEEAAGPAPLPTGDGLFAAGCPVPGEARARVLTGVDERPWGPESLAGPGDVLLLNEVAAFVIQGVDDPDTYYHYGGGPIDAVAVTGCEQAGPELLEEVGFVVGQLDLADFNASSLHQVRGQTVEVVADGSDGGPAVVEVHGTDDRFWLVELTLVRGTYTDGGRRELGPLFGLDITLRHTLRPGSAVLETEVLLDGEPITDGFLVGALVFPSDELDVHAYATGDLAVGGFGLDLGVPWLAMGGAEGSQALALPGANTAYAEVAGVRALLDLDHAAAPLEVVGAAEPAVTPFLLAVGATDAASASAALEPYLPEPLGAGVEATWVDVAGEVVDADGPVAGATVEVRAAGGVIDRLRTDAEGRYAGRTIAPAGGLTVVASAPGRDASAEGPVGPVTLGAAGAVRVEAVDDGGSPLPVRVELERTDGARVVHYALPGEALPVPPGAWTAWVSRGYEYAPVEVALTVPEGGEAPLAVTLDHLVDPLGWVSIDTHVHAEVSADSATLAVDRFRTAAAAGLEVMVSTDHEAIVDLSPARDAAGLADTVAYGLGSEVTATVPEHVNAWPFPVDADDPRGSPVRWYQLGFPDLYAAIRARGARVVQLNHARVNGECGILCVLDWDRLSPTPAIADAPAIGLPEGTEVWSWDFDAFEVMNGLRSPLLDPDDPRRSGALVDWLAFHNLGHRVTGTAVTDVHGLQIPGEPRTYLRVPDDTPGVVTADDAADATLAGRAVMSAGAFAEVAVNGAGPGDRADASEEAVLSVVVTGLPGIDVTRVEVLVDCDHVATLTATDPDGVVKLDTTLPLSMAGGGADAYVVVLGFGEGPMPRGFDDYDPASVPRFITNPIFLDGDLDGAWTPPGPKACATGVER